VQDVESLPTLEVPDIDGSFQSRTPIEVCCESAEFVLRLRLRIHACARRLAAKFGFSYRLDCLCMT